MAPGLQELLLVKLPAFLFVLGLVVTIHELGHFLAAKAVGIRVEQFSIGYPPRVWGKRIGDTDYCLSLIPLGGYVKMAGMIDESMENPEKITGAPDEFMSKNTWQKMLVISAGVIMNFLLAVAIYTGVTMKEGVPQTKDPIVEAVNPDFPAAAAGIKSGDRIVAVNGAAVTDWQSMVKVIHANPETPVQIRWERDGQTMEAAVTPKRDKTLVEGEIKEVGLIGVGPRVTYEKVGFATAIGEGWKLLGTNLAMGGATLKMLFTGQAGIKDLGGPVKIAEWSGQAAKAGFTALLLFAAFISINIGMLNILPFPVLDGGHLAMVLVEAVARRPISTRVKLGIQQVGMLMLLMLIVVITFNDLGGAKLIDSIKRMF